MINALLSQNFDVKIYALFSQIFGDWKTDKISSKSNLWIMFKIFPHDRFQKTVFLNNEQGDNASPEPYETERNYYKR